MGKKLLNNFSSLLGLFLLGFSIVVIHSQLKRYDYRDIFNSLTALPQSRLYLAIALTGASYFAMATRDTLAFWYLDHKLAYSKSLFTGLVSAATTQTVGFALLTGSAIRYRFYSAWGVSTLKIAQLIVFVNITFWLGVLVLGGALFLSNSFDIPAQVKLPMSVRPLGIVFLLSAAAYLLGSIISRKPIKIRGQEFRFPSLPISLAQFAASSIDWMVAAAVLYVLLPPTTALSYWGLLGIFLLAMTAGVVSTVPGGLGVFETIILLFLSSKIPPTVVLGSLLGYRAIYYFLPLLVATGLLGLYEMRSRLISRDS